MRILIFNVGSQKSETLECLSGFQEVKYVDYTLIVESATQIEDTEIIYTM